MATSTSGLTYSPAALDPYPIETELAKTAYNQPEQQTLMDQYWFERQANTNLYGREIEQNRQLQEQQMRNALQQELIKQYHNAGTTPGVAEALQGAGAGLDPAVLALLHNAAATRAASENASHYGTAASGFSTAGMTPEALTTNLGIQGFGLRPDIQIGRERNATTLAAANIRAAASGDGGGIKYSAQSQPDPSLGGATVSASAPKKMDLPTFKTQLQQQGWQGAGATQANPPPSQRSGAPGGNTSLQPKGGGTPQTSAAPTGGTVVKVDPGQVKAHIDRQNIPEAQRKDIAAGGYTVIKKPDGSLKVRGATGKEY